MIDKTLPVAAIKNGTVIDHIRPGQAHRLMHLLRVIEDKNKVTMGLNLPSQRRGLKDLLKIENRALTADEANEVMIFSPEATINLIEAFEVVKKIETHLPNAILRVFLCPNSTCITHGEPIASHFHIKEQGKHMKLTCHYCEKTFDRDQVKVQLG